MPPTLVRQDTGAVLILDGIVSSREALDILVTQHPVQNQSVVTDHSQPMALARQLEWWVSPDPTIPGITAGPERLTEVRQWLDAVSTGVALTLNEPGTPNPTLRDMRLQARPWSMEGTTAAKVTLTLLQVSTATQRTADLGRGGTGKTPRPDAAAGRTDTQERGPQTPESRPSLAVSALIAAGVIAPQ